MLATGLSKWSECAEISDYFKFNERIEFGGAENNAGPVTPHDGVFLKDVSYVRWTLMKRLPPPIAAIVASFSLVAILAVAVPAQAQVLARNPGFNPTFRAPRLLDRTGGPQQGVDYVVESPGVAVSGSRVGSPPVPPGYVPWEQRMGAPRMGTPRLASMAAADAEEIAPGMAHKAEGAIAPVPEGAVIDEHGVMLVDPMARGCHSCGIDGPACGHGCATCGFEDDETDCCLIPCPSFRNFTFFAGTQGFTNPGNQAAQGSFGFNEGIAWGAPIRIRGCDTGIGAQVGIRATQSNFSGSDPNLTINQRNQTFVTLGLFRRVDWGLQWGVVYDYMQDKYWYNIDLQQIRGEISWLYPCEHELGFWFAASTDDSTYVSTNTASTAPPVSTWQATDLYAFFYRRRFDDCGGGWARVFGGWTGDGDGLLGFDMWMPMTDRVSFQVDATYLIPNQGTEDFQDPDGSAVFNEAWNLSFNLVWHPRCTARRGGYYRPLLNVANNGSFIVNRVPNP